jgi:DNA (cytosine-5)-methyltransferase 1|nr:MAG TPA: Cytosine specific methyltransferase [Caudoviricetes sp.]
MKIRLLELCAGYGSQALALKNLGIDFYSEIAEFDKYASQAYMQLHGETKNYGDIYKIDETKLPYFDMITYSTPCFTEDSLVLTEKRGFQKIIDIQIGEKVITHDGNYKTVENVINNGKKKTVKIYGMGIDEIHTTPNHLFYVREKSHVWNNKTRSYTRVFSEPVWKQADSLKRTDYMGIPINKKSEIPEWNGITFVWSDGRKDRYKNQLSQYMNNKDFWWLIGRYIADGWFRNNGGIIIGCGKKKFVEMKEKCDSIGLNYNILEERTVIKFYYQLKELELFVQSFGKYAYGKKIPSFVMDLPVDLLNSFLNGYMSGDGCFTNGRFKATSVSRELIYGLAQCIAKVYKQPYSIYKTERPKTTVIEGRTVNQKDTYELCFKKEKRPQDKAFYEDGFIWFPVTKVEEDEIETVYDLTVEENHSFTVQGVIVHNCQDFSVAGKGKGGDKGSGTRSSLLWECERIIRAVKPKYLLMENVKNLLSDKHRHNFNEWFKVLEGMGYTNYYKVLNAKDYGIPQNRERIFCVSILGGGQYLFPNPKPLEKRLKDMLEDNVDEKYYLSDISVNRLLKRRDGLGYKPCINGEVAVTLTTKPGQRNSDNYIQEPFVVASRGRNIENPSDRTAGKPTEQRLEINKTGCSNTLTSVQEDNYVVQQIGNIIETNSFGGNPQRGRINSPSGCSPALNTCQGGGLEPKILCDGIGNNPNKIEFNGFHSISPALMASDSKNVKIYSDGYRIRKLTPRECFRLMGVKDEQFNRLHGISNSQLYKLAGNSIVVDVLEAIFKNLLMPETTDTKGQLSLF